MGKGTDKIEVEQYRMSAHIGVCVYGAGIQLRKIFFGDKEAWSGALTNQTTISLNLPDLFGGNKKEGGVVGQVEFLPGKSDQTLPERLAGRFGLTTATCPGFRGFLSLFLTSSNDADGFLWTTNTPYIKAPSVVVRRPSIGLDPDLAFIELPADSTGYVGVASNPAHILYEVLTDPDWGKGGTASSINIASFEAAAQTLFDEDFGLTLLWSGQSTIEAFVQEVLDHIQATLYDDPLTGQQTLKLLRADYVLSECREINPDNAVLTNFRRKAWGEAASEVVVTWTNPESEKEETVSVQDLATIAIQGNSPSTSRNYYGIRSQALAQRVAERDLAAASQPIAACEATLDRSAWNIVPGAVQRLNWPEHGLVSVPMRVTEIRKGDSRNRKITVLLQEDIFGLPSASYSVPTATAWVDGATTPVPLADLRIITAPAYLATRALGVHSPTEIPYPDAPVTFLARPPSLDTYGFELWGDEALPTGDTDAVRLASFGFPGSGTLVNALVPEVTTTLPHLAGYSGSFPRVGDFIFIGDVADELMEIALVASVTGSSYTVSRGVLDTVPRAWASGTTAWVVGRDEYMTEEQPRTAGETVVYRFLTQTRKGKLAYADAPEETIEVSERPHLPFRPANLTVGGVAFGTYNATALAPGASVNVTWANRNRITESSIVLAWNAAGAALEAGQTTTLRIWQGATLISTVTGLTGSTHTFLASAFPSGTSQVEAVSVRDGLESLQGHRVTVTR